jgi:hypothetical protein
MSESNSQNKDTQVNFPRIVMSITFCLTLFFGVVNITKAKDASSAKTGFTAVSTDKMNWVDAKAYCHRNGGKLPRINNSDEWDGQNPPLKDIPIDGFGYGHRPWSEVGLPNDQYWTGTGYLGSPGYAWIINNRYGSKVYVDGFSQSFLYRAACVPSKRR